MAAIIWLVLMVVFLMMEASSVSMVSLWFGAGALAALITALLGGVVWVQIVVFLAVSGLLLACLRPLARKYFTPRLTRTNVDSVLGATGLVTVAIDNVSACGQVKLGAMEWTARSSQGETIPKGTLVQVDRIEGVKAFVSPVKVETSV